MAPFLFILALDSAYKVFCVREDIGGIQLQTAGRTETIVVFGYADDTAFFLRHHRDISKSVSSSEYNSTFCSLIRDYYNFLSNLCAKNFTAVSITI